MRGSILGDRIPLKINANSNNIAAQKSVPTWKWDHSNLEMLSLNSMGQFIYDCLHSHFADQVNDLLPGVP